MLGSALRSLRKQRGLTLKDVETLSRVSYVAISNIETGKKVPRLSTLCKLMGAYDMSLKITATENNSKWEHVIFEMAIRDVGGIEDDNQMPQERDRR